MVIASEYLDRTGHGIYRKIGKANLCARIDIAMENRESTLHENKV
jgi:hypothetical protein